MEIFPLKNNCDKGLKIHKKKINKLYSCEVCDAIFDAARDLRVHKITHSYTNTDSLNKKCKTCDFECESKETMEVHLGKGRTENF